VLLRADDRLVPKFLEALKENGQQFLADMLVTEGLNMFVVLCLSRMIHGVIINA